MSGWRFAMTPWPAYGHLPAVSRVRVVGAGDPEYNDFDDDKIRDQGVLITWSEDHVEFVYRSFRWNRSHQRWKTHASRSTVFVVVDGELGPGRGDIAFERVMDATVAFAALKEKRAMRR